MEDSELKFIEENINNLKDFLDSKIYNPETMQQVLFLFQNIKDLIHEVRLDLYFKNSAVVKHFTIKLDCTEDNLSVIDKMLEDLKIFRTIYEGHEDRNPCVRKISKHGN
jgi:hypothetical protein